MSSKSFAVLATGFLLLAGLAPAVAASGDLTVDVEQPEAGGEATVTVAHNGTAAENASVDVNATDADYAGEGSHTTDENGTVTLPAPEENVTVDVAAEYENHSASTTAELLAATDNSSTGDEPFGQQVSAFVRSLLNGTEEQQRIGRLIASWVVENNPGNAPEHAGPPDDAGPPASAGPNGANAAGNETGGNETASSTPGNSSQAGGNGPPDDAGKGNGNGKAKGQGR